MVQLPETKKSINFNIRPLVLQTCQPERVKNLEIFFSSDKKSGDFTKSSEN
jgi:hypothetical protein